MNILQEVNQILASLGIPAETGVYSGKPPDMYIVVTPMSDVFEVYADNLPQAETQDVRLSLFCKGNYLAVKNRLVRALLQVGFVITDRVYIGHEDGTGYHHLAIDIIKEYGLEG
jgi:hypothetical protein